MNIDFKAPLAAVGTATGNAATVVAHALDPQIDSEIMIEIGERKILEIRKHWMASGWAISRLAFSTALLIMMFAWSPVYWYGWVGWFAGIWFVILVSTRAAWRILEHYRDRFVITNQRILRVDGVIGSDTAMIPLRRITDVTVKQTWLGRLPFINYGHFIFESAGQVQGLDEIRYVFNPKKKKRVLMIAMNGENPDALVLDPAEGNPNDDGT